MRRSTVLAGLLACLTVVAGCVPLPAQDAESASADRDVPPRVPLMVVLDASGSMRTDDAPGVRFDAARRAVSSLVGAVDDAHEMGMMLYGSTTGSSDAEKAQGCREVTTAVPFGPLDEKAFNDSLLDVRPRGFTPIGRALETAAKELPAEGERAIVLVSDGLDTCGRPDPCAVAERLTKESPGLVVHTLGFRIDDPEARRQLTCIAERTGGIVLDAASAPLLRTRLLAALDPERVARSLTPVGYRGLRIGMTAEQARSAVPGLDDVPEKGEVEVRYVDCSLLFDDGVLVQITTTGDETETVDGVAVGDDVGVAREVYGAEGQPVRIASDTVTYAADTDAGTGFRIRFEPADDSTADAPTGRITQIILCRCLPRADTRAMWGASIRSAEPGTGQVWNGEEVVVIDRPEETEQLVPVGFVGDGAVFRGASGAHGHSWTMLTASTSTGEIQAERSCEACDSAVVHGSEIVVAEAYTLEIAWLDSALREKAVLEAPDDVEQAVPDFGDPLPYVTLIAADQDDAYLLARRTGDPDDGYERSMRVLRVGRTGETAWSGAFSVPIGSGAGTLDGDELAVTTGAGAVLVLDRASLDLRQEIPAPDSGAAFPRLDGGVSDLQLTGLPCQEYCPAQPVTHVWEGRSWRAVPGPGTVCGRFDGGTRMVAAETEDESALRLVVGVGAAQRSVLEQAAASICEVG